MRRPRAKGMRIDALTLAADILFETRSDRAIRYLAMGRIEKTIFISYRRTDESWALAIFQDLTQHGYDVFIDYDGIASGNFETVILENIRARAHFLVLLTPSALGRCRDPEDWMRREIEAALDNRRNIVPLMVAGFDFDTPVIAGLLAGKLAGLKKYNGLEIPKARYFSTEMERLRTRFLNVPIDAVLHPASDSAQQVANEQKDKATIALADHLPDNSSIAPAKIEDPPNNIIKIQFANALTADLVTCELAVAELKERPAATFEIVWPPSTINYDSQLRKLMTEVPDYRREGSSFEGLSDQDVADFARTGRAVIAISEKIKLGAGRQAKQLINSMSKISLYADQTLINFLTLCNFEMIKNTIFLFRYRPFYQNFFPMEYECWWRLGYTTSATYDAIRQVFKIDDDVFSARAVELSGKQLNESFWGPKRDILTYWPRESVIRGFWVSRYVIPQNELRLLRLGSGERFEYDEEIIISKVRDSDGNDFEYGVDLT
jgi:hypothetical protein